MNRLALIFLCGIMLLAGTSCSNKDVVEENNQNVKKIAELERKIDNLQAEVDNSKVSEKNSKDEKEFYLSFIKNLTKSMSQEYLLQIAKEQWKYNVLVDKVSLPANGIIELDTDTFNLTVSEEQTPYPALPLEIHNKGKISGNLFSNHIKFLDIKPNDTTGTDGTIVSSTTYTFKNLEQNSIVNLEISTELQERLGLETNVLTIKAKALNGVNTTPKEASNADANKIEDDKN